MKFINILVLFVNVIIDLFIILNIAFSLGSGIYDNIDLIRYLLLGLEVILLIVLPILTFKNVNFSVILILLILGIASAIISWNIKISVGVIIDFMLIGINSYYLDKNG